MLSFNQSDINRLFSELETAEKIVITTHFKPDGDAMGSSLAMYGFIRQFFCSDVKLVLNDRYPQSIAFMVSPEAEKDILTYDDNQEEALMAIKEADHIVALDFNAFHRTDRLESALSASKASSIIISTRTMKHSILYSLIRTYLLHQNSCTTY